MKMKDQCMKKKRVDGVGRKPLRQKMKKVPVKQIYDRREKGLRVSQIFKTAFSIFKGKALHNNVENNCENSVKAVAKGCCKGSYVEMEYR